MRWSNTQFKIELNLMCPLRVSPENPGFIILYYCAKILTMLKNSAGTSLEKKVKVKKKGLTETYRQENTQNSCVS